MRLDWRLSGDYGEMGGKGVLQEAIEEALALIPQEHLRRLDTFAIHDRDPKRKSLGIWRADHSGFTIEIYAEPHLQDLWTLGAQVGGLALRLHLAETIFHEVGHHVTRVLNRRAAPPRKAAQVEEKIEKWANEYAEKRLTKLCDRWLAPGGRASSSETRQTLGRALHALRLDHLMRLPTEDGTTAAGPSS